MEFRRVKCGVIFAAVLICAFILTYQPLIFFIRGNLLKSLDRIYKSRDITSSWRVTRQHSNRSGGNGHGISGQYSTFNETERDVLYDDKKVIWAAKSIHDKIYSQPVRETCRKRLPSCIIIGVFKCGTRELIDFMEIHPNISVRGFQAYELDFFFSKQYKENDLRASYDRLRNLMPCSYSDQITVFKHPGYFEHKLVPQRLYTFNKKLKMILVVREPVKRLISQVSFRHILNENGACNYIREHVVNETTGEIKDVDFVRYSTYDTSMERYLQFFNLSQILVIETTELQYDPVKVLARVEKFLGLSEFISHKHFVYNTAKRFFCIKSPERPVCYGERRGRTYNDSSTFSKIRRIFHNYFEPHNKRFFAMIQKTFEW